MCVYLFTHLEHPQPIDRRIKSATVGFHVISLLRRLTLYTSLHIVDHIKRQSYYNYYNELIKFKSKEKCKHLSYNLNKFPIECAAATTQINRFVYNFFYKTSNNHIYKMKDLVNGNTTLIENDGLIVEQKSAYHNGISNGDR